MTGGRGDDDRSDVAAVNKTFIKFPVEQKNKFMFRIRSSYSPQRFISKPSYAFEFIFEEQACVDGYEQFAGV